MTFKMTPGRDWVEQINRFMDDYNGFSNGWQDAGKRDDSTKRWGMEEVEDGFVGINGVTIDYCLAHEYVWNNQPVKFLRFKIEVPTIRNGSSLQCIQLPFLYNWSGGFIDNPATIGWLRAQDANTNKLNLANDSGTDVHGEVWGDLILL